MICTFFGHRECPELLRAVLKDEIKKLIEKRKVQIFYVGNKGKFDMLTYSCLKELKTEYPHIEYRVVLEKIPSGEMIYNWYETLVPQEAESWPPKFAIDRRNRWIDRAEYVVAYITHSYGGAAKFADIAHKKKKKVINIADF